MSASSSSSSSSSAQHRAFAFRAMTEADLPACHRLSLQLKWPHQLKDWQFLLRMGQGVVLESRVGNQPPIVVGSAMCHHHGERHAAIGMVIVQPDVQRLGLARRLMQRLQELTGSRIQVLNATAAAQPLYAALGFAAIDTLHQYQGSVVPPQLVPLPPSERVRPLGHSDGPRIAAQDARATGMDRSKVLAALAETAEGVAIDRDGDMLGFALVRRFGHGRIIGPVVAPDALRAKALIAHWINTYSDSFIRIDVYESGGLADWLGNIGLTRVDSVVQMSRSEDGKPWRRPTADVQLFSIINQALG